MLKTLLSHLKEISMGMEMIQEFEFGEADLVHFDADWVVLLIREEIKLTNH